MEKLDSLKSSYQQVLNSSAPTKIKKTLLEGILSELSLLSQTLKPPLELELNSCIKVDNTNTAFTSTSVLTLNSTFLQKSNYCDQMEDVTNMQREELQVIILEKQRVKCYLNEEIQNLEDDNFQIQKILITKRDYSQELERKIARATHEIGKMACHKKVALGSPDHKTLGARIKSFFII